MQFVQNASFDNAFAGKLSNQSPDDMDWHNNQSESLEPEHKMDTDDALNLSSDLAEPFLSASRLLAETLTHKELKDLLGNDLYNGFRNLAKTALGRTPELTKESLSAALLLQYGGDLFAQKPLRDAVAKKLNIDSPGRWHSGRAAALRFVREAGFDEMFAGTPSERSPDDVEWFSGRDVLKPLEDFQKEVLSKCKHDLNGQRRPPRAIVTLPTGGGKTRVASEYVTEFLSRPTDNALVPVALWVAHTEELLEQAVEALRQVWSEAPSAPLLRLDRRFGPHGKAEGADEELLGAQEDPQILVVTPQRLLNDFERWQKGYANVFESWCDRVRLVVIDEAHRAAAPQYKEFINFFEQRSQLKAQSEPYILGLTATPFRNEFLNFPQLGTSELFNLFQHIVEPDETLGNSPRETLQTRQVLAKPVELRIATNRSLTISEKTRSNLTNANLGATDMESIDRELMGLTDEAGRRSVVFQQLLEIIHNAPKSRVLYFGPSVTDAGIIAFMLRALHIRAAFVSGTSSRPERRRTIADFREGRVQVLCNCEVLTTGFDAPLVTHVVIARPTASHVLFEQMVGRGLRGPRFGGTEVCDVIYFVDNLDVDQVRLGYDGWRAIWGLDKKETDTNP